MKELGITELLFPAHHISQRSPPITRALASYFERILSIYFNHHLSILCARRTYIVVVVIVEKVDDRNHNSVE
jgi:hypothetical protein